jgi:outer membrane protein assembly factor BamB
MRFRVSALALLCAFTSPAQNWNQWRGPLRDGAAPAFQPPPAWPASLVKAWSVEAGTGYSSPVASETHVFVLTRQNGNEVVQAFDLSRGAPVWKDTYPAPFRRSQYATQMADGPFSTPLLHDGRLYTLGVSAILTCYDSRTGRVLWRKDYSRRVSTAKLFTGTAMSPLAENGALIVSVGDDSKGTLAALDLTTGTEKWQWEEDGAGYASPVAVTLEGVRQIVTMTDKRLIAMDASGRLLWSFPFPDLWNENIVTPVQHGNRILISGVRNGTTAVDVSREQDRWSARVAWQSKDAPMYMSSPVVGGGRLYGFSSRNKGQLFCQDIATGKLLWSGEGRTAENASLVLAGDAILALTEAGDLIVYRKSPARFEQVARYRAAGSRVLAHLAPISGGFLVKDETSLTLWKAAR